MVKQCYINIWIGKQKYLNDSLILYKFDQYVTLYNDYNIYLHVCVTLFCIKFYKI